MLIIGDFKQNHFKYIRRFVVTHCDDHTFLSDVILTLQEETRLRYYKPVELLLQVEVFDIFHLTTSYLI